MAERFVSLATLVRAGRVGELPPSDATAAARLAAISSTSLDPQDSIETSRCEPAEHASDLALRATQADIHVVRNVRDFAHADVVHELALMRLASREAFERAAVTLLETLARDVLGRELVLAPSDIAALVEYVLATAANCEPVGIAVSRADRERVHAAIPVRVDDALGTGDLVVDVRDGAFVSTFALRLDDALARVATSVRV